MKAVDYKHINYYNLSNLYKNQLSFILPLLTISSIFIDQSLLYLFSISSSIILNSIDCFSFISNDYILDFSILLMIFSLIIIFSFIIIIYLIIIFYFILFNYFILFDDCFSSFHYDYYFFIYLIFINQLLSTFSLSNRSTYFVLHYIYFQLLYSLFFIKGIIHLIEVYTGLNSNSLYHIYYYSSFPVNMILITIFILIFLI